MKKKKVTLILAKIYQRKNEQEIFWHWRILCVWFWRIFLIRNFHARVQIRFDPESSIIVAQFFTRLILSRSHICIFKSFRWDELNDRILLYFLLKRTNDKYNADGLQRLRFNSMNPYNIICFPRIDGSQKWISYAINSRNLIYTVKNHKSTSPILSRRESKTIRSLLSLCKFHIRQWKKKTLETTHKFAKQSSKKLTKPCI